MSELDQQTPEQHRQRYLVLKEQGRAVSHGGSDTVSTTNPDPLPADLIVASETIPGGWYWSARIGRGQTLRILNSGGTAGISAFFWNADDTAERYNSGDTVKIQWSARLGKGRVLFSDMGRVLASITEDRCGHHDALAGGSTALTNAAKYDGQAHRNSRDNFLLAAGKFGLGRRDVGPAINFFAGVRTDDQGSLSWVENATRPGDFIDLRAEMNLLVTLSNCPHPLDPNPVFAPHPVEAIIWRSPAAQPGDLCRNFSEEARRGFDNNAAYWGGSGEPT